MQLITNNFGNLKVAQARYSQALEALADLHEGNADQNLFVPLTGSLYIPGKLSNVKTVLVDIGERRTLHTLRLPSPLWSAADRCAPSAVSVGTGTGYFMERSIEDARVFLKGKLGMLAENIERVGMALSAKRRDLEAVTVVLQAKMQAVKQAQDKQVQQLVS